MTDEETPMTGETPDAGVAGEERPIEEGPAPADPALEARAAVEALLYASGKPFPVEKLAEAAELSPEAVEEALATIAEECSLPGRGIRLDRVAGGVRLVSKPEFDFPVRRLLGIDGKTKLSMAALETLSIVAYRQPCTAPEIAELRGVSSSSSIRTLLDRKLLTTAGRKEVVGMPFLYKTTKEFLVHFGLSSLTDLPKPEELEALYGVEPHHPQEPAQVELFPEPEGPVGEEEALETAETPRTPETPETPITEDVGGTDSGSTDEDPGPPPRTGEEG